MKPIIECNTCVNYSKDKSSNSYIVIHSVNVDNSALELAELVKYRNMQESFNYIVDKSDIVESVPADLTSWHCGLTGTYIHKFCRNNNSISVEFVDVDFTSRDEVISNTAKFIAYLMKEHSINIDNVLRHYDVTHKDCPKYLLDDTKWEEFKSLIMHYYNS